MGLFNAIEFLYVSTSNRSCLQLSRDLKVGELMTLVIKRPARDACLCMGELPAPPAPHFVFLITL